VELFEEIISSFDDGDNRNLKFMKREKYTIEHKENGNIVFSYKRAKHKDTSLQVLIPLLILGSFSLWELITEHTLYSFIIVVPLLFFFSYRWIRKTEKKNEAEERQISYEILNPIINKDITLFGDTIKELERKYIVEEKDYSIGSRYVLVLLSNGNELRYNIINPKNYDKIQVLEIDINPIAIK